MAIRGARNAPTVSRDCRKPKAAPRKMRWGNIRYQHITRCATNALVDAVGKTCAEHRTDAWSQCKERLRQRAEIISEHCQSLAVPKIVTKGAGKELHIIAVASATPSISPTARLPVADCERFQKKHPLGWLTKPSIQMSPGIWRRVLAVAVVAILFLDGDVKQGWTSVFACCDGISFRWGLHGGRHYPTPPLPPAATGRQPFPAGLWASEF